MKRRVSTKWLLPQIEAVTDTTNPNDRPPVQKSIRDLHDMQQQTSHGQMPNGQQYEELKKSLARTICGKQRDKKQYKEKDKSSPLPDLREYWIQNAK
jgi:hypothetical protein